MNMETVKPMPVSMQTLKKFFQLQPLGSWTNPNLTASQENENTPTNFPTANPKKTARPTPLSRLSILMPSKFTPALANAKTGITK